MSAASVKVLTSSISGRVVFSSFSSRRKMVAVSCRVAARSGANVPSPSPVTTPFSAAHATAPVYQVPAATSEKPVEALSSVSAPAARARTVTSMARVSVPSGSNAVSLTPLK